MENPDPSPPERIVPDRWSHIKFKDAIPLDVKNLVKVSKSIDNAFAALAISWDADDELVIWGAIDQQGQRTAFVSREADEGAESPGVFKVTISGVGDVEVFRGYTLLGALRRGRLAFGFNDVLAQPGPIWSVVQTAVNEMVAAVRRQVGIDVFQARGHWPESIAHDWRQARARILLGIQRYGHGGALLLTPDNRNTGLRIKYPISYNRLNSALNRLCVSTIRACDAQDEIYQDFLDTDEESMPVTLYLDESVFRDERDDTRDEVTGCVRFIASLARVDGLIVMNRSLTVRGYGGIVSVKQVPQNTWIAADPRASKGQLQQIRPAHFGTRHQSMMSICFRRPGSVGFVVSEDGDVRAMTRVDERLIVWEDIKLRLA